MSGVLGSAGADGFPVGGEGVRLLGGSCGTHDFRLGLVWSGVITARVGPVSGFAGDGCCGSSACADLGLGCCSGLWGSMARCRRSSSMVRRGGVVCTGRYFLKNLRLRCGHPSRAVNADNILVELADLDYDTRVIPFSGVWASLVLEW